MYSSGWDLQAIINQAGKLATSRIWNQNPNFEIASIIDGWPQAKPLRVHDFSGDALRSPPTPRHSTLGEDRRGSSAFGHLLLGLLPGGLQFVPPHCLDIAPLMFKEGFHMTEPTFEFGDGRG